ncbi:class I SAM-dependent methyltransferase [Lederbergia lenta]|uniref:MraW methylase family protein n=1 Tax=Lederbergia lenta TaxID=1467 RepID=A0A2X4WNI9_LEDLE|nr:class I SAM-dependent methyltransferase [Lederbergia lenta]MEC2326440.1 class I SAM-dependent methyltransferase [Lederbergia lenta]SQI61258.1 MraW methylase family protein [Lederbergia lenta]
MNLPRILDFARNILQTAVNDGDVVVDATVGNGHDTLFLTKLVGSNGYVYGFDIQDAAIIKTNRRLETEELNKRTTLFQTGHEQLLKMIPIHDHQKITGAIFNLGYLPKGDKSIVTKPDTTIYAVEQLLTVMPKGGTIVLVVYHGHPEGMDERDALLQYVKNLDQENVHVLQYGFINQKNNPPFILALEKK